MFAVSWIWMIKSKYVREYLEIVWSLTFTTILKIKSNRNWSKGLIFYEKVKGSQSYSYWKCYVL